MSQLSTPKQMAKPPLQKGIANFFQKKMDSFTTPTTATSVNSVTEEPKSKPEVSIALADSDIVVSEGTSLVTPMNCETVPVDIKAKEDSIERLVIESSPPPKNSESLSSDILPDPSKKLFQDSKEMEVIEINDSPVTINAAPEVIDLDEVPVAAPVVDMSKVSLMPPLPPRIKEVKKRKNTPTTATPTIPAASSEKKEESEDYWNESELNAEHTEGTTASPDVKTKTPRKYTKKPKATATEESTPSVTLDENGNEVVAEVEGEAKPVKKAKINRALKALESYNYTGSKEACKDEKRATVEVNYAAFDSENIILGDDVIMGDVELPADEEEEASEAVVKIQLTPEIEAKIKTNKDSAAAILKELMQLEKTADMKDQDLDLVAVEEELIDLIIVKPIAVVAAAAPTAVAVNDSVEGMEVVDAEVATEAPVEVAANEEQLTPEAEAPVAPAESNPVVVATVTLSPQEELEALEYKMFVMLRAIECRRIQGSSLPKAELIKVLRSLLESVRDKINVACVAITSIESTTCEELKAVNIDSIEDERIKTIIDRQQRILGMIENLTTESELFKEIDVLSSRKPFGFNAKKNINVATDESECYVWRWIVSNPLLYFTKNGNNTIKEVSTVRNRYNRAIKAYCKVCEDLATGKCTDANLASLEEKALKAQAEIEKANEKRRAIELKRANEAQEKAAKEALKEQKRKEKEENDLKKKQLAEVAKAEKEAAKEAAKAEKEAAREAAKANAPEKEKKEKVPSEREIKKAIEAEKLEKQKTKMMGFFAKSTPPPSATKTAASSSSSSDVICLDDITDDVNSPSVPVMDRKTQQLLAFEQAIRKATTADERAEQAKLASAYKKRIAERRQARQASKNKRRKPFKIHVTVNVNNGGNAFGEPENVYSEIKEKFVDSRMRTMFFCEDHRPAYVGTFSKKSTIISGRRPLAKDEELFNYEYDSEAEWEEEVEGEDIDDSGGEDDDDDPTGANELQYDDFFRRDNDYGSDAESDVEGGLNSNVVNSGREKEEELGPRFIRSSNVVTFPIAPGTPMPSNKLSAVRPAMSTSEESPTSVVFTACNEKESDTQRLSQYSAVVFKSAGLNMIPYLGTKKTTDDSVSDEPQSKKLKGIKKKSATIAAKMESALAANSEVASEENKESTDGKNKVMKGFDDSKMSEFILAVHGNKDGCDKIVAAFHDAHPHISKLQIKKRLLEISDKAKHAEGHGTMRFVVKNEIFQAANMEPTAIEYTPLKKKKRVEPVKIADCLPAESSSSEKAASTAAEIVAAGTPAKVAPVSHGHATVTSVSSFINTFMPSELLVPLGTTQPIPTEAPVAAPKVNTLVAKKKPAKAADTKTPQKSIINSFASKTASPQPSQTSTSKSPEKVNESVSSEVEPVVMDLTE